MNEINHKIINYNNLNNYYFKFYPEEKEIDNFLETIKKFGKIDKNDNKQLFKDSLIIKNNILYIKNLKKWINSEKDISTQLLYRKSKDGDSFDTFHKLCDNQGENIILIQSKEIFIIGGYTPLNWDNNSGWKEDNKTFLFSLTNNKIFTKIKKTGSIYCSEDCGPWFAFIGFYDVNNMSQAKFYYKSNNDDIFFKDFNDIIPNERKHKVFDVEEVEVYKILFN